MERFIQAPIGTGVALISCKCLWLGVSRSLAFHIHSLFDVSFFRGKIHYTDMFALLKQIDPPLGFGSKCPDILAYKRLVRMNMPIDDEGKVHFTTTLFALVRVNLQIFMRSMDEMDQADQELRTTIGRTWPFVKRDGKIDLLVPRPAGLYFT